MEVIFGINKNTGERIHQRGPTCHPQGWRAPYPLGVPSGLVGHLVDPRRPSSAIWCVLTWKKLEGSTTVSRRNLGRTNLGLRRSCSAEETSLREGEIEAIVITNDPLIVRGSIFINIFTSTISSQTLVHLLYPIFVSKP